MQVITKSIHLFIHFETILTQFNHLRSNQNKKKNIKMKFHQTTSQNARKKKQFNLNVENKKKPRQRNNDRKPSNYCAQHFKIFNFYFFQTLKCCIVIC